MIPTNEQLGLIREAIESSASDDEAIAKVVEVTAWPTRIAAEWVLVARHGEYDLDLSGL